MGVGVGEGSGVGVAVGSGVGVAGSSVGVASAVGSEAGASVGLPDEAEPDEQPASIRQSTISNAVIFYILTSMLRAADPFVRMVTNTKNVFCLKPV